jgi:hypothetical protein
LILSYLQKFVFELRDVLEFLLKTMKVGSLNELEQLALLIYIREKFSGEYEPSLLEL